MDTEIIAENVEIQELIADIYVKLYDYKKAMEYYINVLKLYIDKEMYDNALVIVNKILNIDNENINAYEAMAQIYIKKGMKNNLIDAYTKLSIIYEKIGEKEKAAEKRALLQKLKML